MLNRGQSDCLRIAMTENFPAFWQWLHSVPVPQKSACGGRGGFVFFFQELRMRCPYALLKRKTTPHAPLNPRDQRDGWLITSEQEGNCAIRTKTSAAIEQRKCEGSRSDALQQSRPPQDPQVRWLASGLGPGQTADSGQHNQPGPPVATRDLWKGPFPAPAGSRPRWHTGAVVRHLASRRRRVSCRPPTLLETVKGGTGGGNRKKI